MKEMFTATLPCKEINHAKSDYWQRQKIPKQKLKKMYHGVAYRNYG